VKQHQQMVSAVKPRDTAITNGGLIGKVTKVDENEVELEVAQGVRVRVVKSMLSDIRPHGTKPAND
jgi:preprotein translocase subunit YajC